MIMSFIRKQFIDVIQLPEMNSQSLIQQFPMQDQEIQNGAQLVVRESQIAIFVNEGVLADVFQPGTYTLTTKVIPLLTNLKNWDKLFDAPFKSDVYFINSKLNMGVGWGTSQPITVRDKDLGIVRIRAFGQYSYKISDPKKFLTQIAGLQNNYSRTDLETQLRSIVVSSFSSTLGEGKVPFLDMASNQHEMALLVKEKLKEKFEAHGLLLQDFNIENLNLPEEVQKKIDERSSMGVLGDLNQYSKYKMAESIPLAAQNEGGMAGIGASMSMGMAMADSFKNMNNPQSSQPQQDDMETKLTKAKSMLDKSLISQDEYNKLKADLLSKF